MTTSVAVSAEYFVKIAFSLQGRAPYCDFIFVIIDQRDKPWTNKATQRLNICQWSKSTVWYIVTILQIKQMSVRFVIRTMTHSSWHRQLTRWTKWTFWDILKCISSDKKMIKFSMKFVTEGPINNASALAQTDTIMYSSFGFWWWLGTEQATCHYTKQ